MPVDPILPLPESSQPLAFADLLTALHTVRYTGAVTFHFLAGTPNAADMPREPIRFRLKRAPGVDTGK